MRGISLVYYTGFINKFSGIKSTAHFITVELKTRDLKQQYIINMMDEPHFIVIAQYHNFFLLYHKAHRNLKKLSEADLSPFQTLRRP